MERRISFFGGTTRGRVTIVNGDTDTIEVNRDVGFDQDIDGHWLVWAVEHNGTLADLEGDGQAGAIVVRHPDVIAFLSQLGKLIAYPAAFQHEPEFLGAEATAD